MIHDTEIFRQTIARMAASEVAALAAKIDKDETMPEQLIELFGDMGLLQLLVPEKYGGPGGDTLFKCVAKEEVARHSAAVAVLAGQNSAGMVLPLLHAGTEQQRQHFLPDIARGRTLTAIAVTEPHCGSDIRALSTKARRDGGCYLISGQKSFITMGSLAHWVLVIARIEGTTGSEGVTAFLVEAKTPGFQVGRRERTMGLNGIPDVELRFDNMRVPTENRIGGEGEGLRVLTNVLNHNRPGIAAIALGIAQGALDVSSAYASERVVSGKRVADFQAIRFMLADMALKTEAARALLYGSIAKIASGNHEHEIGYLSSLAKCFASDMANQVTGDAVLVFGGAGFSKDYPVERMMRDAKVTQIWEGTSQIQRVLIARHLLGPTNREET